MVGYFTGGGSARGRLQRTSVWTPSKHGVEEGNRDLLHRSLPGSSSGSTCPSTNSHRDSDIHLMHSYFGKNLALCLAYNRCSVNTCQITGCIMLASGCHLGPEEPGRWEEDFWTPAMPYISSIFSESYSQPPGMPFEPAEFRSLLHLGKAATALTKQPSN
ncbi:unnamed protein product [Nyctereutes procyonoides]|uniref:(raccoon dog) hypothetical protein n=1 Tax=Nyctereutes procyonoides TaxID=34880 RepID=A0A811YAV9_NYCPR|nr:unnamed protein product [Nyctereutes procyonoides]